MRGFIVQDGWPLDRSSSLLGVEKMPMGQIIVQELCESRGGRPGLSVLTSLLVSVDVSYIEPCFGIGHSLSLICQLTSVDIKHHFIISEVGW